MILNFLERKNEKNEMKEMKVSSSSNYSESKEKKRKEINCCKCFMRASKINIATSFHSLFLFLSHSIFTHFISRLHFFFPLCHKSRIDEEKRKRESKNKWETCFSKHLYI